MDRMNKEIQLEKMEREIQLDKLIKEREIRMDKWGKDREMGKSNYGERRTQGQNMSQGQNKMRNRIIRKGDRIFARLTMGARTVIEFMIDQVESMTDLLLEVHRVTSGVRGLCKLYVRNQSRGWAQERPVMLYGTRSAVASKATVSMSTVNAAPSPFSYYSHMQFPWETH